MKTNNIITKKDLKKVYHRWLWNGQTGWNYEKMQALGYCYTMMPILRKIYKDDPDGMKKAVLNHLQFFNTNPKTIMAILGMNVAMEEELGTAGHETISSIKTGLMGPFAGFGDPMFTVIPRTIFGSIAAYMALEGNPLGVYIWLLYNFTRMFLLRYFVYLGYNQGTSLVKNIEGKLKAVTEYTNILGLTVVGALIPTAIRVISPYVYEQGDVTMRVQDMLDKIMPGLLPAAMVGFVYWLLGRKNMDSTKAIFIVILVAVLGSIIGVFG